EDAPWKQAWSFPSYMRIQEGTLTEMQRYSKRIRCMFPLILDLNKEENVFFFGR
ncbi:hypothetical protein ACJX0J_035846, partial [Zea mays]